jgi:hypothetical protein
MFIVKQNEDILKERIVNFDNFSLAHPATGERQPMIKFTNNEYNEYCLPFDTIEERDAMWQMIKQQVLNAQLALDSLAPPKISIDETIQVEQATPPLRAFKSLPKGARFVYPDALDAFEIWVVLENYGHGLIAKWEGLDGTDRQSICSFVDDDWTLASEVHVIC